MVVLLAEPPRLRLPSILGAVGELKVKLPDELGDDLGDLEQADVLSDASPRAVSELCNEKLESWLEFEETFFTHRQVVPIHLLQLLLARLDPPLRPELRSVLAPDVLVVVRHPRIHTHLRALREEGPRNHRAAGRHDAQHRVRDGRVAAQRLLDHGLQVRHVLRLGVRDRVSDLARRGFPVDLGAQLLEGGRGAQQVVHAARQGDGGGVAAGGDVGAARVERVEPRVGAGLLHLEQLGEEVVLVVGRDALAAQVDLVLDVALHRLRRVLLADEAADAHDPGVQFGEQANEAAVDERAVDGADDGVEVFAGGDETEGVAGL